MDVNKVGSPLPRMLGGFLFMLVGAWLALPIAPTQAVVQLPNPLLPQTSSGPGSSGGPAAAAGLPFPALPQQGAGQQGLRDHSPGAAGLRDQAGGNQGMRDHWPGNTGLRDPAPRSGEGNPQDRWPDPATSSPQVGARQSSGDWADRGQIQRVSNNEEIAAGIGGDSGQTSALEQKYAAWWREILEKSRVAGQPLELYRLLQTVPGPDKPVVIGEYWRLGAAIVDLHLSRQSLALWREATEGQSEQPIVRTVTELMEQEIEQAEANINAEQLHVGIWLSRYGLTDPIRPVDAPFLGPYDTKLAQFARMGVASDSLSRLAGQVDRMKQEIVSDAEAIEWAEQEWRRARAGGDLYRLAAMIQMRKTAYRLWVGRVTRYNDAIAHYAYAVAGDGQTPNRQLAMLLRQPVVAGRLLDLRDDPQFNSAALIGTASPIQPVGWTDGGGQPWGAGGGIWPGGPGAPAGSQVVPSSAANWQSARTR